MAHYIAELIDEAENASAEERPAKMRACCEAILRLWRHRHELPNGKRPFEEFEPILRALESLDLRDGTARYFRSTRTAAGEGDDDSESATWLKAIDSLDYSTRLLIRYCLTRAAETALDKSAEWVALAEAAGANEGGFESAVFRVIVDENSLLQKPDPDAEARKRLVLRCSTNDGSGGFLFQRECQRSRLVTL